MVVLTDIEDLRPVRGSEESPRGRLAAIGVDEYWTLVEIHALLVEGPVGNPVGWAGEVQDLAGRLVELHRRGEVAFWAAFAANPPWQRCH
jgi:hypothetical protein